jgi:hypothetical protein
MQMVSSRNKGKTIHSETREMINRVNYQCQQEPEKKLVLPTCRADKRTANCRQITVVVSKQIIGKLDLNSNLEQTPS